MKSYNLRRKATSSQSQSHLILDNVIPKPTLRPKHQSTRSDLEHYRSQCKASVAGACHRSKGGSTSRFDASVQRKSKRLELIYNKWFIHPSKRMKQAQSASQVNLKDQEHYYKGLYQERYADSSSPFRFQISEKLRLLDILPKNDFQCLQEFRKNQLRKKKRVPQIVEMLTNKHRAKTQV